MIVERLLAPEQRYTSTTADLDHWRKAYPHFMETASGEVVNAVTALGLSAFFACMRNISEDEAKLPFHVHRRDGRNREPVPDHPVDYLLSTQPNPEMTAMAFREMLTAHAVGWGNGYAEIQEDGAGRPIALWPLNPTTISTKRGASGLIYVQQWPDGSEKELPASRVFHLHGLAFDGITGYSILQIAREVLGAAIATQKFGGAFFGNGATFSGTLEHPGELGDKAFGHLEKQMAARAGAAQAFKMFILEEGMKYQQLGVDPEQAQFIETRQFQVEEVARFFRMPPHKIQHLLRATFSNIEEQDLEYGTDTMLPWLVRWEQEAKVKLFSPAERNLYVKHNMTALLRADAKTRAAFYSVMLQNGVYSVNDVLELEDRNTIPNGDKHYHQLNMVELGKEPVPAPKALPVGNPVDDEDDEDEGASRVLCIATAHAGALTDAYGRILRAEADKVTRAAKRGDLEEWAADFYAVHGDYVRAALLPAVRTAVKTGTLMGCLEPLQEDLLAHVDGMAARHIEASRADMGSDAIKDWLTHRAERQGEAEARLLVDIIKEPLIEDATDE